MKKILVTGSLAYDHIMFHDGVFHEVILPEHLHNLNVCFLIKTKKINFGGTGGNIAYNLSLLGEECILYAAVGKDFSEYKKWLEQKNISTKNITIIPNKYTASGFVTTDRKGNQIWNFYPGAMEEKIDIQLSKHKNEIKIAIIAPDNKGRMISVSSQCKQNTIPYIFDPGQSLPSFSKKELLDALDGAYATIVNEYELELLLEKTKLTKKGLFAFIELLIVTRGKKGSTIENTSRKEEINRVKPKKEVDPTGCGDAYRAGILKGLKENYSWKKMGQLAALMGTYNIERSGTQNHRFTMEELKKRYKENFGNL